MIELTEKAVSRVVTMAAREDCEPWFRIAVRGGGYSGLSYVVEFDGDGPKEKDHVLKCGDVVVMVDPKSLKFIDGMTVDYETNLLNAGFRFNNPHSKKACSCGESFLSSKAVLVTD